MCLNELSAEESLIPQHVTFNSYSDIVAFSDCFASRTTGFKCMFIKESIYVAFGTFSKRFELCFCAHSYTTYSNYHKQTDRSKKRGKPNVKIKKKIQKEYAEILTKFNAKNNLTPQKEQWM